MYKDEGMIARRSHEMENRGVMCSAGAMESYHWKERKKKPFCATMWLLRLTITGKKF